MTTPLFLKHHVVTSDGGIMESMAGTRGVVSPYPLASPIPQQRDGRRFTQWQLDAIGAREDRHERHRREQHDRAACESLWPSLRWFCYSLLAQDLSLELWQHTLKCHTCYVMVRTVTERSWSTPAFHAACPTLATHALSLHTGINETSAVFQVTLREICDAHVYKRPTRQPSHGMRNPEDGARTRCIVRCMDCHASIHRARANGTLQALSEAAFQGHCARIATLRSSAMRFTQHKPLRT